MSCDNVQVIFLFVHVIVTYDVYYFCPMGQFRSRSEIFLKTIIIFLGVKLVLTNFVLSTIYQSNNKTISDVLQEILHQIIFYVTNKGINL